VAELPAVPARCAGRDGGVVDAAPAARRRQRADPTTCPYTTAGGQFQLGRPARWPSTAYREQFFALDPFIDLPPFTVVSLQELIPLAELRESEYYRRSRARRDPTSRADAREPRGMEARLRFAARRRPVQPPTSAC
jgi:hypothetical protein